MRQIFVAWVPSQRREAEMRAHFGWEVHYLGFQWKSRYLRPFEYLAKAVLSAGIILRNKPDVVWAQIAPTPLLHIAVLVTALLRRKTLIIADCHTGVFLDPWIRTPLIVRMLRSADIVLAHNDWIARRVRNEFVPGESVMVLEDKPATVECPPPRAIRSDLVRPWVVMPCSFDEDEPIAQLMEAARLLPRVTFVLTGKTDRAKRRHSLAELPENVRLAGYVPIAEYEALLCQADVVLGLTLFEGVQVSTASEAIGAGTPMVLADTQVLRELFNLGAVYVNAADPASIAQGIETALEEDARLREEIVELRRTREARWGLQAQNVNRRIEDRLRGNSPRPRTGHANETAFGPPKGR